MAECRAAPAPKKKKKYLVNLKANTPLLNNHVKETLLPFVSFAIPTLALAMVGKMM